MELIASQIEGYAKEFSSEESPILRKIRENTEKNVPYSEMLCGPLVGNFLGLMVKILAAKRVLEIGTFTGYSSLFMAENLGDDGKLTSLELSKENMELAQKFHQQSPHGKKIEIINGPALDSLKKLEGPFDFVFIDADKENYPQYYETALKKLRIGGAMVLDNCFWDGRVLSPKDAESMAIHSLNTLVSKDPSVHHVLLTIRDGLHLVYKSVEK